MNLVRYTPKIKNCRRCGKPFLSKRRQGMWRECCPIKCQPFNYKLVPRAMSPHTGGPRNHKIMLHLAVKHETIVESRS